MHLTFPNRRDRFTKEELRCLSAALGFHDDIFAKHLPPTGQNSTGVETKVILELIERKVFNSALHRSHNMHDGVYNAKVLEKAIRVLSNRIISFADLKDIRMAFEFYECEDLSGLDINAHVILRTLKMCGRVISPRKLMDHVKHMSRSATDRVMLYEFMDFVPMCEKICDVKEKVRAQNGPEQGRRLTVTEVANFEEILLQEDKKEFDYLDDIYEQSFFRPSFAAKPTWRLPPQNVINNKEWKEHVSSHRQVAAGLDATLGRSNRKVFYARHGTPGHHVQFVDVNIMQDKRKRSEMNVTSLEADGHNTKALQEGRSTIDENKATLEATTEVVPAGSWSQTAQSFALSSSSKNPSKQCWFDLPKYSSKRSKLTEENTLVTQQALQETHTKIVNLMWDLEMKDDTIIRDSKEYRAKTNLRNGKDAVEQDREPSVDHGVLKGKNNASKGPQRLDIRTWSEELIPTTPDIYNLLHSRLKERDSLLNRGSSLRTAKSSRGRKTRVSRTEQGRSKKSRNSGHFESCRKYLATA